MEKSKKNANTTENGKRKKYRKHINHEVTCAVCGKKFGSSRSTAKYCSNKCRRLAYYAAKGYLGRIVPSRIKVPKIGDSMPIEREAEDMRAMLERAKTKVAEIRATRKSLLFVREMRWAKYAARKTNAEMKKVAEYLPLNNLKTRLKDTFGAQKTKSVFIANLTYVVIGSEKEIEEVAKELSNSEVSSIVIGESKAKTVCPELL